MGGYYDQIAIGLTSNLKYPTTEFAGYLEESVGYHGDDGKCYANSEGYCYGVKFGSNDVIGCGITLNGNVYFTHNGCILPLLDTKLKGNIYTLVSLRGKYCSVKINHKKFIFNHNKQKFLKNPVEVLEFSKSTAYNISNNKEIIEYLQYFDSQDTFSSIPNSVKESLKIKLNLIKNIIPFQKQLQSEVEEKEKVFQNSFKIPNNILPIPENKFDTLLDESESEKILINIIPIKKDLLKIQHSVNVNISNFKINSQHQKKNKKEYKIDCGNCQNKNNCYIL